MKILTWNVNGLRAIYRKGAWDELLKLGADIMCIQEIKAEAEQLTDDQRIPAGYFSYFHSSQERKGYAGTAIYSRTEPREVVDGIPGKPDLDRHGRLMTAYYENYIVVNGYFPNGKSKTAPLAYQLAFYEAFLKYIENLNDEYNIPIITTGDYNAAHTEIDLARPKENADKVGFLPVEREWFDELVSHGWVDVYRDLYPDQTDVYTFWDQKTRARDRNVGWRIDYFWVNQKAMQKIYRIDTLTDFAGSDHCPVQIEFQD